MLPGADGHVKIGALHLEAAAETVWWRKQGGGLSTSRQRHEDHKTTTIRLRLSLPPRQRTGVELECRGGCLPGPGARHECSSVPVASKILRSPAIVAGNSLDVAQRARCRGLVNVLPGSNCSVESGALDLQAAAESVCWKMQWG